MAAAALGAAVGCWADYLEGCCEFGEKALMLTLDALRAALKRVQYRSGWRFVLYESQHEGVWMSIKAEVDDPNQPGKTVVLNIRTAVPPIPHETYFWHWLAYRLARVESREAREFLRIDGRKYDDPHAPDANE